MSRITKKYVIGHAEDLAFDYGIQALASDFAYDKDQAFFQKSLGHHFMTFSRGFASGGMQYLAGYNSYVNPKNELASLASLTSRQAVSGTMYGVTFAIEYSLYGLQKALGPKYNFYGGGAPQKFGIYHSKVLFYSLTLK
jgi:hypothetical protein